MNMKSDDLERLEESQEMQQLIHAAKEQYEQEKISSPLLLLMLLLHRISERDRRTER